MGAILRNAPTMPVNVLNLYCFFTSKMPRMIPVLRKSAVAATVLGPPEPGVTKLRDVQRGGLHAMYDENWTARAACAEQQPDELFVQGAAQREARALCYACPVRRDCLADALENRVRYGVWGGMTERDRRAVLRRMPFQGSWAEVLADYEDLDEVYDVVGLRRPSIRPAVIKDRSARAG